MSDTTDALESFPTDQKCPCGATAVSVVYIEIEPFAIYRCLEHTLRMESAG